MSGSGSGLKRIVMHWTAGTYTASGLDRKHYHFLVDGKGEVVPGIHPPEHNIDVSKGNYAAHTLNCNTGAIGVAIAAMGNASEHPFVSGVYPITAKQVDVFVKVVANLCKAYGIEVTRKTVLTHAEVEPTLGIKQRGKWDITWLPGMEKPGDPVKIGDHLRERILAEQGRSPFVAAPETLAVEKSKGFLAALLAAIGGILVWLTKGRR